jgi:WD40 repeat protein
MPGLNPARGQTELEARWQLDLSDYATSVSISHDGSLAALGTGGGNLVVVETETGRERWRAAAHDAGIQAMEFSRSAPILATAGQDGRARLFGPGGEQLAVLPGKGGWVDRLAWAPDGKHLATASGRVVRVWTARGEPLVESEPHPSTVTGLAWRKDSKELATCCYGGVYLWPLGGGAAGRVLRWKGSLISLAWSPDSKVIACGSQDASVHFWRLPSGRDSEMRGYPFKPRALAWDAGSTMLATAGDARVTVWSFLGKGPEGKSPQQLEGHQALCTALAFAPRGSLLASGSQDTGILFWDLLRSPRPQRYAFLENEVTSLVWHPDGERLIGADVGGRVALFRVH